jgi:hypothetical protein
VLLRLTRLGLPLAIAAFGLAGIVVGHADPNDIVAAAGVVLLGVALIVWMINWMFQMSLKSNRDREQEEQARKYFDQHGRWPDD